MSKKILILVPSFNARGGITNYYEALKKHLPSNFIYFKRGTRNWPNRRNTISETLRVVYDIVKFIIIVNMKDIEIILTSTSLGKFSIRRDAIFIWLANVFKIRSLVFFRGWNPQNECYLTRPKIIKKIYFNTYKAIVLNNYARTQLIESGYKAPVILETTAVDTTLVKNLSLEAVGHKYEQIKEFNFLYLARIEKEKGIFIAIEAFELLYKKFKNLRFQIVGDGRAQLDLENYLNNQNKNYIRYHGFLTSEKKRNIYLESHIYLFPSYTEGMPTSVLEAMTFGLPIITRAVGGLNDFFVNGENGFITTSFDPTEFATLAEKLLNNKKLLSQISINNYLLAKERFSSNKVAKRLIEIIEE